MHAPKPFAIYPRGVSIAVVVNGYSGCTNHTIPTADILGTEHPVATLISVWVNSDPRYAGPCGFETLCTRRFASSA